MAQENKNPTQKVEQRRIQEHSRSKKGSSMKNGKHPTGNDYPWTHGQLGCRRKNHTTTIGGKICTMEAKI